MAQAASPAPLPPWLGDPRRTVFQVEGFVVGAAVLLFFQLIFGFCRRQSNNKLIQGGVWVSYTLSFPLVTYTLGMMRSSPIKSPMYPVWGVLLFLVAGCTNSVTAYDLDDNKQWKRHLFELLQYCIYAGLLMQLLNPTATLGGWDRMDLKWSDMQPIAMPLTFLSTMIFVMNLLRVVSCWMVNWSDPSKVVADYMKSEHAVANHARSIRAAQEQQRGPIRMADYRYLVGWYGYSTITHGAQLPIYTNDLNAGAVTIDDIWGHRLFDSEVKDVCLSFSLFLLLKRRFFGMKFYEADLPATRDFVLRGLLSENGDDYARAFRIIEVELGFLYDFFFTKYACIYENEIFYFLTFILKTICTVMLGVSVYRTRIILETLMPIVQVDTRSIDIIITLVILGALLIVDILQAIVYLASDWASVSLACNYVKIGSCQGIRYSLLHQPFWVPIRRRLFKYWQNKIGQYSVIDGCGWRYPHQPSRRQNMILAVFMDQLPSLFCTVIWNILTCQYCCNSVVHFVRLPDVVKREIAASLRSSRNGNLTNGEATLRRYRVLSRFSWTLRGEDGSYTHTMLVWHIATNYCEIALPEVEDSQQEYRAVASSLSRYCAYLMAYAPELLPGNSADTKFTVGKVMEEANEALPRGKSDIEERTVVDSLLNVADDDQSSRRIFVQGLKLGRKLEVLEANVPRWKMMAEFWAEIILYVAPSNNFSGHIEQLANGGELLTHVWALLSHAGILTRPKEHEDIV